jgi:RNA polymerase sigma factor (sigma-70 family)
MLDTLPNSIDYQAVTVPGPAADQKTKRDGYATRGQLAVDLEQALSVARPRLLRLAHRRGVTPDATDDVVQETLIEAWRHLNHLRSPERFDAWLDGICRNVVLRWARTQGVMVYREASLSNSLVEGQNELEESSELDIPDPMALDPVEELSRQDLAVLLDRALGYLPQDTRALVELHYLAELSQDETAARIGITPSALKARLHRARRQLRQVLNSELRTYAEEFGLVVDEEAVAGWHESRIWCFMCGGRHLYGIFELLPNGRVDFRLRCPDCSQGVGVVNSGGYPALDGIRTFRPALKRVMLAIRNFAAGLSDDRQACPICGTLGQICIMNMEEFAAVCPFQVCPSQHGYMVVSSCGSCGAFVNTSVNGCFWLYPVVQSFMRQHPRSIFEPETLIEYAGQAAIRIRLVDITSAARLTLLAHPQTLQVLATFQE